MVIEKNYLIGMDASHHNTNFMKKQMRCWDFEIHKLSEGATYVDPTVEEWWHSRTADTLNGVYHYMTGADVQRQAEHAASLLARYDMVDRVMFIIDYEDSTVQPTKIEGVNKLLDFVQAIRNYYPSYQPVIYCNKTCRNAIIKYCATYAWDAWCLWLADYEKNVDSHSGAWTPVMRQWTNVPFDMDIFFGTPESWKTFYKLY